MALTGSVQNTRSVLATSIWAARARSLRLAGIAMIGLAVAVFIFGTAWDIQWHPSVGRDRALTPPHVLMLAGIIISGLTSLSLVLVDSWIAWQKDASTFQSTTRLFGVFYAPLGIAVAGFGALLATVAFPLDDYWHTLYGIDVTLWAPFHVMIASGMGMAGLGALYALAAEQNRMQAKQTTISGQLGIAALLVLTFGTMMVLIAQGTQSEGLAQIGRYQFALYPILLAFALPLVPLSILLYTRRPGIASIGALLFLALRHALYLFVPWVMDLLVAAEGLSYRSSPPDVVITPFNYPVSMLFVALAVDSVAWLLWRSNQNSDRVLLLAGAAAAVIATFWERPWATQMPKFYPSLDMNVLMINALPFTIAAALIGAGGAVLLSRGLINTQR